MHVCSRACLVRAGAGGGRGQTAMRGWERCGGSDAGAAIYAVADAVAALARADCVKCTRGLELV